MKGRWTLWRLSRWQLPRRWRSGNLVVGALLVGAVGIAAVIGPWCSARDPLAQDVDRLLGADGTPVGPGARSGHWLGADSLGRDELTRLLHGGRVSLAVAMTATAIAVLLGLLVGLVCGYFGGWVDQVAMRSVDVLLSIPFLLIAMAIHRVVDSPSLGSLCLLLGGLSWTTMARVIRTKTMQVRQLEYVQAARALGMSSARILWRHVLPNVLSPALVIATTLVAQMILVESAMSYLGLGIKPPEASWGSMLREGQELLAYAPRLVLYPGALIVAAVFGFNLLGEGLRQSIDPDGERRE